MLPFLRRFDRFDRRLLAGFFVLAASFVMLAAGLVSIIAALNGDGADLPSEGTIQEIVAENGSGDTIGRDPQSEPAPIPPARFSIPRLLIDAPVITLGLDENRVPLVPDRGDLVAWYDFSAAPGRSGNAVFSGHVDWQTRQGDPIPGVFYRLREMEIGDLITITLADGTQLNYRVTGNVAATYDDPNVTKAMGAASSDIITLITCGGTWTKNSRQQFGGSYSHRVIVRAELTANLAGAGLGGSGS